MGDGLFRVRGRHCWLVVLVAFCGAGLGSASAAVQAADGQVVVASARFTVITPGLIRMEYSPSGKFVDEASWLAVNRAARFAGAKIATDGPSATIDTGEIHLSFHDDGKPFSPANLSAEIHVGDTSVTWRPGTPNSGNLGGTIRTLDGAHQAIPLGEGVLSRDGWYLLDDSKSVLFSGDWVRARPSNSGLDWYLFGYGKDYRSALKSLTTIGGPVPLPRKYALGIWFSRYWEFTTDGFKQIVNEYAAHGFPLDMLVMDMGWHLNALPKSLEGKADTWTGYTWDKALIPDPAELIRWVHDQGVHVTLNDHPAEGVQPHEEMYADFMRAMGRDPATLQTIPFDAGDKKYLDTFFAFTHYPREKEGVDFWWLDWQQFPRTRSIPELENLRLLNWYNYTRTSTGGLRGESFSRWAGWGDHRYPIQFSGDADTGWAMLAFEVPFTATAGNVGAFFWSHDIGGHMGGRNEESYARWCQFGALSAALRSHSTHDATTDRRPWNYPAWAEASMKESFGLRSRLMPYLYTSIHESTADSVPFTRPLYMDYPNVEAAYHNSQEYMYGDNLLVAPIASPGVGPSRVASQAVWFPPGEDNWFDFFTGERFGGGESAVASAPIDQFPLFVRGGVPLPMQPWNPRPGTAPLDTLLLRCYPGRDGITTTSALYEDDGQTTGYQKGESATTALTYTRTGDDVTITIAATKGTYTNQPKTRALTLELPNTQPGVTVDDAKTTYDPATFTTRIELPAAPIDAERTVKVHVAETPADQVTAAATNKHFEALTGMPYDRWRQSALDHDSAMWAAISAAQGIAVLPVNRHHYGLGYDVALTYLHNHHTAPETLSLTAVDAPPQSITVAPGQPLIKSSAAPGSHALTLAHPITLSGLPGDVRELNYVLTDVLPPEKNLATKATPTASTGDPRAAIDGSTDGYPGNQHKEWVTLGEKAGAWIRLTWDKPTEMTRVLLYDRPNLADHVEAGTLEFSDGTRIDVPPLPNDGVLPGIVEFPAKTCTWVKFTVTAAGKRTENIGLSEIAVTDDVTPPAAPPHTP
jgi:alpha-glucosidase (family GH31 glycosyl hydrolase)